MIVFIVLGIGRCEGALCSKVGTDCDVHKVVLDQIDKLELVNSTASEWREFVDGGDQDNLCLKHDILLI